MKLSSLLADSILPWKTEFGGTVACFCYVIRSCLLIVSKNSWECCGIQACSYRTIISGLLWICYSGAFAAVACCDCDFDSDGFCLEFNRRYNSSMKTLRP